MSPDDEPSAFEDVRVSTVYGADGLPRKAGVELHIAGEQFPRRLTGEAVCGTSLSLAEETLAISFFHWSMDGMPALGCYESAAPK
jgi:hypothetical protein